MGRILWNRLLRGALWLIAEYHNGRLDVLTMNPGDDNVETLPVFSFKEEAELFLWFEGLGADWRVRQTTPGEFISLLYGPCVGVEKVALDPSAEMFAEEMSALVSLSRTDFVRTFSDEGWLAKPRGSCFRWRCSSASSLLRLRGRRDHGGRPFC